MDDTSDGTLSEHVGHTPAAELGAACSSVVTLSLLLAGVTRVRPAQHTGPWPPTPPLPACAATLVRVTGLSSGGALIGEAWQPPLD